MRYIFGHHRQGPCAGARGQRDQLRSRLKIREPRRHVTAISTITAAVRLSVAPRLS
jgi:hypothetical protein